MKRAICTLTAILISILSLCLSGCVINFEFWKAMELTNVVWTSSDGKISFHSLHGYGGHGYIYLGEQKVDAFIEFAGFGYGIAVNIADTVYPFMQTDNFHAGDVSDSGIISSR